MAWTERYANFDLGTGANDGTTEANAWRTTAAVIAGVAAGQRVNIKRQTAAFDLTATVTFNVNGTALAPIYYRAYTTTIGDGGFWECAYNGGGVISLNFTGNFCFVEGVHFKPGASVNSNGFQVQGIGSWSIRNKIIARGSVSITNMYRTWISIENTGAAQVQAHGTNAQTPLWTDSFIKRIGATTSTSLALRDTFGVSWTVRNCVLVGNGNAAEDGFFLDRMNSSRGVYLIGNRLYNFRHGIYVDEAPDAGIESLYVLQNLFDTMSGNAVNYNASEAGYVSLIRNYYRNCTSGFTNYAIEAEINNSNLALTVDPFVNKAADDLSLNSTADGGQVVRDDEFYMDPTVSSGMKTNPSSSWWEAAAGGGGTPAFVAFG